VGVPVALAGGAVANQLLLGDPLAFTAAGLRYVAVGAGVGVATSLVAGVYPAWKAANKRPVEVLD
jgi:putative ABC transport system permease protein